MKKTKHFIPRGFAFILALCTIFGGRALAQTYTEGSIAGTVFDPSGAAIANATIVIHNDGTNAETTLVSDSSGFFKAPQLPAAVYTVTVNAAGFAPFKETNVIVQVGQTSAVLPHLAPAGASATVEVTGEAPIMNYESPDLSAVLDTEAILNLPLNGSRWSDFTLLTPGVVGDSNGFGLIAFRGISPILNNVEIDGADDNQAYYSEERGRTREGYSTSKNMIQEFQVNTGVYSAEFGRAAGGVINAVTKSGSNAIHGIAYFADRDNDWGAYNPYTTNTINTTPTAPAPTFTTTPYKPKDWRKEWGFDAGGPLKKDKLFWFYGYSQYRRNFPGTGKAATPSSFFALPDTALATGQTCNYTDVMNGSAIVDGAGYISSTGTAASTVDQMACALAVRLKLTDYAAGAAAYAGQLTNLLTDMGAVHRTGDELLNTPKLDWQINDKHHLSVLYHRLRWDSPGGVQTQATNTYGIDGFGNDYVKLDYGLTKLNSIITSRIANELRYQFGRELNDESQQPYSDYTKNYLQGNNGITATGAGGFSPNVPAISLDNPSTGAGITLGSLYYAYRKALPDEHKWQVGDTAAWQKGNHSIKFGVDMIHNYDLLNNTYESNGVYTYSYIGNYFADLLNEGNSKGVCNNVSTVSSPGTATTDYTGTDPCGTFVQGFGPTTWDISTMDYGFFGEDHWKLTPRLTVDAGIRYDYESLPAPYSALTVASGGFTPYLASTNGLCAVYTGPGTCPAAAAEANITNHPSDRNNIGPRLGIALDPMGDGKTTVRLGYGLYYGRVTNGVLLNNLLNTGSPAGQYVSSTFAPNSIDPTTLKPNAPLFPNIVGTGTFSAPTSYFFSKNFQNPQVHEFDFSVQRDLGHGSVFQLSYMGALGRELPNAENINLNPNANTNTTVGTCSATVHTGCPNGVIQTIITVSDSTGTGPIPNGTTFVVPTYSKGYSTTSNLLNPNFGAVNELVSNINSSYHAMVAEIQNKTSKLLQYDVNYTWSHAIDNNQNESTTTISSGAFDPYNIGGYKNGANYGNSNFNVPNRLVAWAIINSPEIQKTGFARWIVNDWSLNPVYQLQDGLPFSAVIGTGSPAVSAYSGSWNGAGTNYWLPAIGRNTYKQKRTMVADVRLEKQLTMHVYERPYSLQLIGEVFNIANHVNVTSESTTAYNFSANSSVTSGCTGLMVSGQAQSECSTMTFVPKTGSGVNASGFGAITNAGSNFAYSPRQIQLSLRLDF
jgi:hypothetical protein